MSARVNVPTLGYVSSLPVAILRVIGSSVAQPHGHDVFVAFGPDDMTDYFIRFVNDLVLVIPTPDISLRVADVPQNREQHEQRWKLKRS